MTLPSGEQVCSALLVAANRAALYGAVYRWLMHELRGPAQAVSLVADLLEQGDTLDEPSVRGSLEEASGRLRSLLDLLDRMLRRPGIDGVPGPLMLREPLRLTVTLLGLQRSSVRLDADQAIAARLPAVRGVDEDVQHALLAVTVNAYESLARQGGGMVRVTAEPAGNLVRLVVADDGPGVAPRIVGRLFEPFVTTKSGPALAGLGLCAARALLQRSGGAVRYEPEGPGARFLLEFPVWS